MTDKIEIKHLSPYLPYNLRVMHGDNNKVMNTGQGSSRHWIGISSVIKWQGVKAGCKPVLHPLTAGIIKMIFNEEMLDVVSIDIGKYSCRVEYRAMGESFSVWIKSSNSFYNCPTWIMTKLLEKHVDVFSLIDRNLALSYSSISANAEALDEPFVEQKTVR